MNRVGVAVFLLVAAVWLLGSCLGHDEKCVATLQAPNDSVWNSLGKDPQKVPLRRVQHLADMHGVRLVKGPPPTHAPHALVSLTCERLGAMWVGLPDPAAFLADEGTFLADESNTLTCRLDNMKDKVSTMFGFKRDTPKQYPGQPRRVYMKNYCGVKFPVSTKSEVARRMHENTRRLEKKMNGWRR